MSRRVRSRAAQGRRGQRHPAFRRPLCPRPVRTRGVPQANRTRNRVRGTPVLHVGDTPRPTPPTSPRPPCGPNAAPRAPPANAFGDRSHPDTRTASARPPRRPLWELQRRVPSGPDARLECVPPALALELSGRPAKILFQLDLLPVTDQSARDGRVNTEHRLGELLQWAIVLIRFPIAMAPPAFCSRRQSRREHRLGIRYSPGPCFSQREGAEEEIQLERLMRMTPVDPTQPGIEKIRQHLVDELRRGSLVRRAGKQRNLLGYAELHQHRLTRDHLAGGFGHHSVPDELPQPGNHVLKFLVGPLGDRPEHPFFECETGPGSGLEVESGCKCVKVFGAQPRGVGQTDLRRCRSFWLPGWDCTGRRGCAPHRRDHFLVDGLVANQGGANGGEFRSTRSQSFPCLRQTGDD